VSSRFALPVNANGNRSVWSISITVFNQRDTLAFARCHKAVNHHLAKLGWRARSIGFKSSRLLLRNFKLAREVAYWPVGFSRRASLQHANRPIKCSTRDQSAGISL
jgi:hypothetical protein